MEEYHQVKNELNQKKSNKGLIATLVIVIILAITAVGGTWYYMNNKAKNDKKAQEEQIQQLQKQIDDLKSQAATTKSSQTKSYITKYDKLKFNYPSNWTLNDTSQASSTEVLNTYGIDGTDNVTLKSQDGFEVIILSGGLGGFACPPNSAQKIVSEKVNILDGSYFLNYLKKENSNNIDSIFIATKSEQCASDLISKNLITKDTGKGAILSVTAKYPNNSNTNIEQIKNDSDLKDFKNFLQSLSY